MLKLPGFARGVFISLLFSVSRIGFVREDCIEEAENGIDIKFLFGADDGKKIGRNLPPKLIDFTFAPS